MFVLIFLISGKVTSWPKVIKYTDLKRSKYSFYDFSTSACFIIFFHTLIITQGVLLLVVWKNFYESSTCGFQRKTYAKCYFNERKTVNPVENYFGIIIPQYEPDYFRSHFRLTRQSFDDLAQKISKCDEYNIKIRTCNDIIMLQ